MIHFQAAFDKCQQPNPMSLHKIRLCVYYSAAKAAFKVALGRMAWEADSSFGL